MLTAGSAGTVSIDTQIFIPDLDIDVFLNTGMTSQDTNEVCLFPAALNGEIRTSLWTPFSDLR